MILPRGRSGSEEIRRRRAARWGRRCFLANGRWRSADVGRGEKYNLLYQRFPKLEAPLAVVLVCFAQEVATYIYGGKLSTSMSTSDMVLIDVAPSTSANSPK
jgi:hypothetical protein